MPATKVTALTVNSLVGTQVLTGTNGDYDSSIPEVWVTQEGAQLWNSGPQVGVQYNITFTGDGSPQTLKYKGQFAGVGYQFNNS